MFTSYAGAFSMNLDDSTLSLFSIRGCFLVRLLILLGVVSEVYPTALPFTEISVILAWVACHLSLLRSLFTINSFVFPVLLFSFRVYFVYV